jgi:hypothetical protein
MGKMSTLRNKKMGKMLRQRNKIITKMLWTRPTLAIPTGLEPVAFTVTG